MPATRRVVRDAGRERQFRFLAGDLYGVEVGRGVYDLAIAGKAQSVLLVARRPAGG